MKFTVFTPTYNRAYTLTRLYESLKAQTFKSFEWLVVDDGSTDNTEELIKSFIEEKPFFNIKYIKTENGGKHRAINRGIKYAEGELTFILDSDDYLTDNALERLDGVEKSIDNKDKGIFAGICGNKGYSEEKQVGTSQKEKGYLDITMSEKNKHGISGDKAEVFYTCILKQYPFPEFPNENFLTESIVWDRISHDGYKLRYFDDIIYICEYLKDGLTKAGFLLYAHNPRQWGLDIYQKSKYKIRKTSQTDLEIYKYYLYCKDSLTKQKIIEYLQVSGFKFKKALLKNTMLDFIRKLLRRQSIKEHIRREVESVDS